MTDFIFLAGMILGVALVGDIVERILRKQQIDAERVIDLEPSEDEIEADRIYDNIINKLQLEGDDNMDYVELNGELIPYNEDDQE